MDSISTAGGLIARNESAGARVALIGYSVFRSVHDLKSFDACTASWPELVTQIRRPDVYRSKAACPLLKLATFGDRPNDRGSLRHDNNVDQVFGIEGDYDENQITPAEGAARLKAAGVRAVIYTSATNRVVCDKNPNGGPRWRVLAPLSGPVGPELREELVSLLNGALGGILSGESWTLSQTFYFGQVVGVEYEAVEVEGEALDMIAFAPSFDSIGPRSSARVAQRPAKPRHAADADHEEVGHLEATGWLTGGHRPDGGVNVRCYRADLHTTDSGPSSTTYFPAGVGGRSEGGFECKHQSCGKTTTTGFRAATGLDVLVRRRIADEFSTIELPASETLPAFEREKVSGKIKATRGNLELALSRSALCGVELRRDTFADQVMLAPVGTQAWRPITDSDLTDLCKTLEAGRNGFAHIPSDRIREMVDNVAEHHRFDSAQHWLDAQVWDCVPRVDDFLCTHLGAADVPYTRAVGRYIFTALAGRVLQPGVKADMVPVLVGPQGAGKSTVVAALAPSREAFLELDLGKADDDQARQMRGTLVIELGELKGLRAREQEALKAFISRPIDSWVEKYKTHATHYKRRSVFFGTTNAQEFLSDDTGHRRWLPVEVPGCASPEAVAAAGRAVERDRDQLWAEGAAIFRRDGVAWAQAESLARGVHARFEVVEPWAERIRSWLLETDDMDEEAPARGDEPFTTEQVLIGAVGVDLRTIHDGQRKRVATVLRKMGYADRRQALGGVRSTWWSRLVQLA